MLLAAALAPLAVVPLVQGGLATALPSLVVLQTEMPAGAAALLVVFAAMRVVGMLWIYFAAWNTWANEVALMALFLVSPVIGVVVWLAGRDGLTRPPLGKERATFMGGRAVVPVFEPVYDAAQPQQGGVAPAVWPQQGAGFQGPPVAPPVAPQQAVQYWPPPPTAAGPPPQWPVAYPQGYVPFGPPPPVSWRLVGQRVEQKRDVLAWHNILLLLFDAFGLASCVMLLLLVPVMAAAGSIEELVAEDSVLFSPAFVLFSLVIQDGILVLFVWHQVVHRRVLTTDDMGVSRRFLLGEGRLPSLLAWGVVSGLVIVGAAVIVELAQAGLGFEAEAALGPAEGDWPGFIMWLLSGCVIAPLSEEFFFRGYAFHAFRERYGLAVGVAGSAVFFSAIHFNVYGFLPIIIAGVGLALVYHRTRSLVPCIVAHAVNNLIALAAMFLGLGG